MSEGLVRTIGRQATRWRTVHPERTVLVVVHNVTAMTRLLDVLPVFEGDSRVQLTYTWNGTDPFPDGLHRMFAELGLPLVPWQQALLTRFDLAIAANLGGLVEIDAPILSLPHGIRYTKKLPRRTGEPENRRTGEPENRRTGEPENRRTGEPAFGLDPQWVLYEGRPIAQALVLSHESQRDQLARAVPAAVHTAVVAGDACFDRLRANLSWRLAYRHALGTGDRQLIVISSTWWRESVLGRTPEVFRRVLAELPSDDYHVAAVLHPNIWYGHGSGEVHRLLAAHERSGLILIPPEFGWRAAVVAADYLIGDHGSVTTYAAALGKPVLLASFPDSHVAPGSVVDLVGNMAPRLEPGQAVRPSLAKAEAAAESFDVVGGLVTSCPDEAADRLRTLCYQMLGLPEPDSEPPVPPDDLTGLPTGSSEHRATAVFAASTIDSHDTVRVRRYPAEMLRADDVPAGGVLVVAADHPGRRLREVADVVVLTRAWPDVEQWLVDTLAARPGLLMAAAVIDDQCVVRTADADSLVLRPDSNDIDPACLAAAAAGWVRSGRGLGELHHHITVNGFGITVS